MRTGTPTRDSNLGTYHYWSDEHLGRYVDEHSFRYNRRSRHVLDRVRDAVDSMQGRSLSWRELTAASRARLDSEHKDGTAVVP